MPLSTTSSPRMARVGQALMELTRHPWLMEGSCGAGPTPTLEPGIQIRACGKANLFTAHNSLTIQNTSNGTLTTVGYPPNTGSYFVPQNSALEYWMGDGLVIQPSAGVYKVKIMLLEFEPGHPFRGKCSSNALLAGSFHRLDRSFVAA